MKQYKWIIIIVSSILILTAGIIGIIHFTKDNNEPSNDENIKVTIGQNGNWYINDVDTNVSSYNIGNQKTTISTGNGKPESVNAYKIYIDIDSFDYYLYVNGQWELRGNIKVKPLKVCNEGDLELHLLEDGTYGVYKCNNEAVVDLVIPSYHNKRPITKLMEESLSSCSQLKNLELPNTINEVCKEALNLSNLELNEYEGCKYIGNKENPYLVLIDATNKMYILDNTKVVYLTNLIFKFTSQPIISNNNRWFKLIDGNLFNRDVTKLIKYNKSNLHKTYTIPNTVKSIGEFAFYDCSKIQSVIIPYSVKSIGAYAFYYCNNLKNITIPYSVKSIGEYAFYNCENLESLEIRSGVENIGAFAFSNCINLTTLIIPGSLTSIGEHAFYQCDSLDSLFFNGSIKDWCNISFSSLYSNPMACGPNFNINNAQGRYFQIQSIEIYNDVTSIGSYQFCCFNNLHRVIISGDVKSIKDYAFYDCDNLEDVDILNSVKSIGDYAFSNCDKLMFMSIPKNVTHIGKHAFFGSENLDTVHYGGTIENWCNISFSSPHSNPMCYATHFDIKDINNKSFEPTEIVIPNTFIMIGSYQFYGFENIVNIEIPNSITSIGTEAFAHCEGITNIEIPNSVTIIDDGAFSGCKNLTSIVLPVGLTNISHLMFSNCESLTSIVLPDTITSIGSSAFSGCINLTTIVLPDGITSIGNSTFSNCGILTNIIIPESVTNIGSYAFFGCESLTICCKMEYKPDGWSEDWNSTNVPVVWNYKE